MKCFLRNLFRSLTDGANDRASRRPRTTRLQVEHLERRLVPTANLSNLSFPISNSQGTLLGTLAITSETFGARHTAQFSGTFYEDIGNHAISIPISGTLEQARITFKQGGTTYLGWDSISFQGSTPLSNTNPGYGGSVSFKGTVSDSGPETLSGTLVQNFAESFGDTLGWWSQTSQCPSATGQKVVTITATFIEAATPMNHAVPSPNGAAIFSMSGLSSGPA